MIKMLLTTIALTVAVPAFAQTAAPAPMDHSKMNQSSPATHAEHSASKDATAHGAKMDCCEKMKAEGKKMDCCEKMDGCDKHDGKGAADAHAGHDMSKQ